jgi:hypothetical protein
MPDSKPVADILEDIQALSDDELGFLFQMLDSWHVGRVGREPGRRIVDWVRPC